MATTKNNINKYCDREEEEEEEARDLIRSQAFKISLCLRNKCVHACVYVCIYML